MASSDLDEDATPERTENEGKRKRCRRGMWTKGHGPKNLYDTCMPASAGGTKAGLPAEAAPAWEPPGPTPG